MSDSRIPRFTSDRLRRAFHGGGLLLLALVVLPFVAFAIPQAVGATGSFVVVSNSMNAPPAPVISTGDVVFVYETPPERIAEDDVITYRSSPDQLTTHRVVDVREREGGIAFETKGDANEEADREPVSGTRVIGTVEFVLPFLGHVVTFAGTGYGIVALVLVPAALLVVTELVAIVRAVRASPDWRGGETDGDAEE